MSILTRCAEKAKSEFRVWWKAVDKGSNFPIKWLQLKDLSRVSHNCRTSVKGEGRMLSLRKAELLVLALFFIVSLPASGAVLFEDDFEAEDIGDEPSL